MCVRERSLLRSEGIYADRQALQDPWFGRGSEVLKRQGGVL